MPGRREFPIEASMAEVLASLAEHPRLVLEAPPGAGKTTQVPLALLGAQWCNGKILMLEPRRIAARAAAGFMAAQLDEAIGETVGYQIRFERKVSAATRIEIVTEGILVRMLQTDPTLEGISAVIFDEFHERHLASDLSLAMSLDVQTSLRPELRLLVMSATLDGERLARFLDAPRITASGRSHPVRIQTVLPKAHEPPALHFKRAVRLALEENSGDVLCFLPGKPEIDRATRTLADLDVAIEALHGDLAMNEQARLLRSSARRRVILATNIAESSLTLPGVRAVVDTGLAREPRFDPASSMSRLETVAIAEPSALQRAGRAGREAPGVCYRLWPDSQRLDPAIRPELNRVELSAFLLELKSWGNDALRFFDLPPIGAMAQALALLKSLGALDQEGRLMAHGRTLLTLGVHPRLATAMLRAPPALRGLACDIAALLEARDPLRGAARRSDALGARISALHAMRAGRLPEKEVDRGALRMIDQAAQQWRRRLDLARDADSRPDAYDIGHLIALAYPDRIARRDEAQPRRYQLSSGRGAQLLHDSELFGEPWLAIAEIRFDEKDSLILRAAPLSPEVLEQAFGDLFGNDIGQVFNRETRAVESRTTRRFAALVLEERLLPTARDAATTALLNDGVRQLGLGCLPWTDDLREWQNRVQFLREACPEFGLPEVSDGALLADLDAWLPALLQGRARLAELGSVEFSAVLHQRLDYAQGRALAEHAPLELLVPSGQQRRLIYAAGQPPVLAVKLQELFGLADTPRIANDRVAVLLHLLSPRQTPIQVTRDLRSFWQRTYPEVKKELKGRYPKHPWPDDPWTAIPTHRAKPRKR